MGGFLNSDERIGF